MPAFTSSTLSRYTGKWLIATGIFELALAAVFLVLGLADAELTFGFGLTAAHPRGDRDRTHLVRPARPPVGGRSRPDREHGHRRDGDRDRADPDRDDPQRPAAGRDRPARLDPGSRAVRGHAQGVRAADPARAAELGAAAAGQGRPDRPAGDRHRLGGRDSAGGDRPAPGRRGGTGLAGGPAGRGARSAAESRPRRSPRSRPPSPRAGCPRPRRSRRPSRAPSASISSARSSGRTASTARPPSTSWPTPARPSATSACSRWR